MAEPVVTVLSTKELGNVIDTTVRDNVKLSNDTKILIARLYDRFRHRISVALNSRDLGDSALWIALIGDMMALVDKFKIEGAEKKEIIVETIGIIVRFEVAAEKKDACEALITTIVGPAIDLAVYFKNQLLDNKKKISACLCPCIFSA